MAEKLSIRIQLEGAKEVEAQLEDLGDTGKQAFVELAKEAEKTGKSFDKINPEDITKKLDQLGVKGPEAFNKISAALSRSQGIKDFVGNVENAEAAMEKFGRSVTRSLGPVGYLLRALGPVGIAIGAAGLALVGMGTSAAKTAEAIGKLSAEAMKLGIGIQQLDQLRLGFERAGIAAETIGSGIAKFKGELDKLDVARVAQAVKELADAGERGFGVQGTAQLKLLEEAAKGVGPAADAAREALVKLGAATPQAASALQRLGITSGTVAQRLPEVVEKLRQMPDSAQRTALAFDLLGDKMGPELIAALQTGGVAVDQFVAKQWQMTATTQQQAVEAARLEQSTNRMTSAFSRFFKSTLVAPLAIPIFDALSAGIEKLDALLAQFSWAAFGQAAAEVFNRITTGFAMMGEEIARFVTTPVASAWQWISSTFNSVIDQIIAAIDRAWQALKRLLTEGEKVGGPQSGDSVGNFARGGTVGGRGSGTSDSNLAWVSRGEHIMPARAVRQPGVLAFLEALRRSGGNLRHVLDGMGRFALGGPVALPAFAGGGLNSMSNVTIQFPGTQPIGGLRAPSSVVEELRKAAVMAQVRSGGMKPSRYR